MDKLGFDRNTEIGDIYGDDRATDIGQLQVKERVSAGARSD